MTDNAFQLEGVTVSAGTVITWVNTGNAVHTATSNGGVWDSGLVNPGASFSFRFTQAGTFPYRCLLHPEMVGSIVVQAAAPLPAQATAPALPSPQATATATTAAPAPAPRTPTAPAGASPTAGTTAPVVLPAVGSSGHAAITDQVYPALVVLGTMAFLSAAFVQRRCRG